MQAQGACWGEVPLGIAVSREAEDADRVMMAPSTLRRSAAAASGSTAAGAAPAALPHARVGFGRGGRSSSSSEGAGSEKPEKWAAPRASVSRADSTHAWMMPDGAAAADLSAGSPKTGSPDGADAPASAPPAAHVPPALAEFGSPVEGVSYSPA